MAVESLGNGQGQMLRGGLIRFLGPASPEEVAKYFPPEKPKLPLRQPHNGKSDTPDRFGSNLLRGAIPPYSEVNQANNFYAIREGQIAFTKLQQMHETTVYPTPTGELDICQVYDNWVNFYSQHPIIKYAPEETKRQHLNHEDNHDFLANSLERGLEACNQIVLANMPFVFKCAGGYAIGRPDLYERFVDVGMDALYQKAASFDPQKGVTFLTHAGTRIKRAMIDLTRGGKTRNSYSYSKILEGAEQIKDAYIRTNGVAPTHEEISDALGISVQTLNTARSYVPRREIPFSELAIHNQEDSDNNSGRGIEFASEDNGFNRLESIDDLTNLTYALSLLPPRLYDVLVNYYVNDLNLRQIGVNMGLTESRICQLHSQAIRELRKIMIPKAKNGTSSTT